MNKRSNTMKRLKSRLLNKPRKFHISRAGQAVTKESTEVDPHYLEVETLKAMDAPGWEQAVNCELLYMEDELDDEDAKLV